MWCIEEVISCKKINLTLPVRNQADKSRLCHQLQSNLLSSKPSSWNTGKERKDGETFLNYSLQDINNQSSTKPWSYPLRGKQHSYKDPCYPPVAQREESACSCRRCRFLGWEDPLEKGMAAHPVFLPEKSHGQRSLAGYSPRGCERVRHDWVTKHHHHKDPYWDNRWNMDNHIYCIIKCSRKNEVVTPLHFDWLALCWSTLVSRYLFHC